MTIQSRRGYFLRREDNRAALAGEPLPAVHWADDVGSDIGHALDVRGQLKGEFVAPVGRTISVGDAELTDKGGPNYAWRAATIGPFPLERLPGTGQPEILRVLVALASAQAETVFCRAVLRPMEDDPAPWDTTPGVREGWTLGYAETAATTPAWLPLRRVLSATETSSPLRGFLQFPPERWAHESAVRGGTLSRCIMACIDLWVGRSESTDTITLAGWLAYSVSYGSRSTVPA